MDETGTWIGIDVAKGWLDVADTSEEQPWRPLPKASLRLGPLSPAPAR